MVFIEVFNLVMLKLCIFFWVRNEVVLGGLYQYQVYECVEFILKIYGELVVLEVVEGYILLICDWSKGVIFELELFIIV